MRSKYIPPEFMKKEFHCPICNVYADQVWNKLWIGQYSAAIGTEITSSFCKHCHKFAFWFEAKLIIPKSAPVEYPHPDFPQSCLPDYIEARNIFTESPRSAAALLRLCVQKLMHELGESGENLNGDIASLVAKGLPQQIQRALDICRVIGNHAVHPGEINIEDTPGIVQDIFRLINLIIEDRITRPREIDELYSKLPPSDREAIEKRDS